MTLCQRCKHAIRVGDECCKGGKCIPMTPMQQRFEEAKRGPIVAVKALAR